MKKSLYKKRQSKVATRQKLLFTHLLLSISKAKHHRHTLALAFILVIAIAGSGVWFSVAYYRLWQLHEAESIINSKYDGIRIESTIFNGRNFRGYAAYALTENKAINTTLRNITTNYFQPCKAGALADTGATHECQVNFTIDFATPEYLQLTYTYEAFRDQSPIIATMRGVLFDRKHGTQMQLKQLFKPDAKYLDILSHTSRETLLASLGDAVKTDARLPARVEQLTRPSDEHFSNYALSEDEKISFIFNDLANYTKDHRPVIVQIGSDKLYSFFNDQTLQTFFPKLKEQKEAERKLAEETARAAASAAAARNHTRGQVAANRSNVNCAVMKCIALTFDDGPSAYTNQMLDALSVRGAVATFFVLGSKVTTNAAILQKASQAHNEIGNHSWSHADFTRLSDGDIVGQVEQTNQAIFQVTGNYPKIMRPPYGAIDGRVISQIGMPLGLWSIDTNDWLHRDALTTYQHVIAHASPGAVVLMHDIYPSTAAAVPAIIDELQRQGYILVTLSELFDINKNTISSFIGQSLRHR